MPDYELDKHAGTTPPENQSVGVLGNSNAQREMAEVQGAIVLAKKFPRNHVDAIQRIKNACQRPGLAKSAMYTYNRGGTDITGPSIRMAEAIAQCWGNLQFGTRELEQENGVSVIEAYCWDMETNTRQVKIFHVAHTRHTKKGATALTDPRDIYETVANNGARRLRACILGIIPGDIIEMAVEECDKTLKTNLNLTPEGIKKIVDAFEKYGVTKAQIEKRILRNADAMSPAQYISLVNIGNSLRDGMSIAADWFPVGEAIAPPQRKSETAVTKNEPEAATPAPAGNPNIDVEIAINDAITVDEVNKLFASAVDKFQGESRVNLIQARDKRLTELKKAK